MGLTYFLGLLETWPGPIEGLHGPKPLLRKVTIMGKFKKGNIVFWKRTLVDLICVVQGMEGDQVALLHMDAPRSDPPILVNASEVTKLAEEQEKLVPSDFPRALKGQREIHFPPSKRGSKKKGVKE